ncbi:hypothetical protein BGX31_002762, partial [Mortierella sp. GBA43]
MSDFGTFKLVSSPHEFGMLLSIGPLYSAQAIATNSYNTIKRGARVTTDERWTRGTFDVKGVTVAIPDDDNDDEIPILLEAVSTKDKKKLRATRELSEVFT